MPLTDALDDDAVGILQRRNVGHHVDRIKHAVHDEVVGRSEIQLQTNFFRDSATDFMGRIISIARMSSMSPLGA